MASAMDLGFLFADTDQNPKHVGCLLEFELRQGSPRNFVRMLFKSYLSVTEVKAPFNTIPNIDITEGQIWREVDVILPEHIIYHSIGQRERQHFDPNTFVAKLHETRLPRNKPLWEVHFIDKISRNKFGIYFKLHHAYGDGISLIKKLSRSLNTHIDDIAIKTLWSPSIDRAGDYQKPPNPSNSLKKIYDNNLLYQSGQAFVGMGKIAAQWGLVKMGVADSAISMPFSAQHIPGLTGAVTPGRQFATGTISMAQIRQICTHADCTVNQVLMTCVDMALHRYLGVIGSEYSIPITVQMPVSIRNKDDDSEGNKIGIVPVQMAKKKASNRIRFRDVGRALERVKRQIDVIHASSIVTFTLLSNVASMAAESLSLTDQLPPLAHTLVSNVPGPKSLLYLKGARLSALYPISVLAPGNYLNITFVSYAGRVYFGLVATQDLKHLKILCRFLTESISELKDVNWRKTH
jgi:WS/DGAT/MGAT family acyltransferase